MCGIISIVKKGLKKTFTKNEIDVFKQMLYADALRGWDATGVAAVKSGNNVQTTKQACTPQQFLWETSKTNLYDNASIFIGHNRAATKGDAKNSANAHPFTEEHITLVHNGTLFSHRLLANVDVDSHAIAIALKQENNIKKVIEQLWGAYALVWYNKKEKRLYLIKNKERPLHVLETDELFVICSEVKLAEWILSRNNIDITKTYIIDPNTLYYIDKTDIYQDIVIEQNSYINTATPIHTNWNEWQQQKNLFLNKIEKEGFKVGNKIEIIPEKEEILSYRAYNTGTNKLHGHAKENPLLDVEFIYDDKFDWENKIITCEIKSISYTSLKGTPKITILCHGPYTVEDDVGYLDDDDVFDTNFEDSEIISKTLPTSLILVSQNNVAVTQDILDMVQNQNCACCEDKFKPELIARSKLIPHWGAGNKLPYRYTYICPDCINLWEDSSIYISGRQRMA